MANMDLSLDDIIQKKYTKPSSRGGRGGLRRGQQRVLESGRSQNQNNAHNNKRTGFQGRRVGGSVSAGSNDARMRIIQKNRLKLTDARDKLAQIAKQSDARLKLDKLRECRVQGNAGSKLAWPGASITRRTGRNGQITLTTNRKQVSQRQVSSKADRTSGRGRRGNLPRLMDLKVDLDKASSAVIRRTVNNEMSSLPPLPIFSPTVERSMYEWVNPIPKEPSSRSSPLDMPRSTSRSQLVRMQMLQPTSLKITARNTQPQKHGTSRLSDREEWNYDARASRRGSSRMETEGSDEDDCLPAPEQYRRSNSASAGRMSSELKARLDTPAVVPRTMGILSSGTRTPSHSSTPPTPTGHRIVVSNLQTSVTHEDIRELFEDIGPLVTSRLVRPGTAEVVYRTQKDAVKAVDVYHNRQLDGQPMKCMLVNPRPPPTIPTSSRLNSVRPSSSSSFKLPTGGKSTVVPDISTIHKALFNKS